MLAASHRDNTNRALEGMQVTTVYFPIDMSDTYFISLRCSCTRGKEWSCARWLLYERDTYLDSKDSFRTGPILGCMRGKIEGFLIKRALNCECISMKIDHDFLHIQYTTK